jgi:hypothetical protein
MVIVYVPSPDESEVVGPLRLNAHPAPDCVIS